MKFKKGQVLNCLWPKKKNVNGTVTNEPRPMVVLRDTNDKPDLVFLVYCTTENKELTYSDHIFIEEGTEEFFLMGLDESTYIVPQINKNMPIAAITGKRGFCSDDTIKKIERVIENWTMGR